MKYYIYDKEKDDFVKDEDGERVGLSSQKEVYDYLKAEGLKEDWIVSNFSLVRMFKIFPVEELPEFFESMQSKLYYNETSNQPRVAQLQQLTSLTWDGDLIGKSERDQLVKSGLAIRFDGWNLITPEGVRYLYNLGFINL